MSQPLPVRRLDRSALLGLAHPLRVRLYDELTSLGPATASELGRRLGESSGSTSYHLRQLERHGFVETDPDRGTGRERWWRAVRESVRTRGPDFEGDPASREAHRLVSAEWLRTRRARQDAWLARRSEWPPQWRAAVGDSITHVWLDLAETEELEQELVALMVRWAERTAGRDRDARYRPVEVQFAVFPTGDPPVSPGAS